jgi:hypothetical protein
MTFVTWKARVNFKPAAIRDPVKAANVRNLRKASAKVRRVGRQKIRRRKKRSAPGKPPSAHAPGGSGLKLILYDVDPRKETAVIGPVLFKTSGGAPVPGTLEHGGSIGVECGPPDARITVKADIDERPFMGPAHEEVVRNGEFAELWKGSV